MKRKWNSISKSIDYLVSKRLNNRRTSVFKTAHLHAKIWRFFKNGTRKQMEEELAVKLNFYCNELITLKKQEIVFFRNVNNLMNVLFHRSEMVKPGYKILRERLRVVRKLGIERNQVLVRNYLLNDKQRGNCPVSGIISKLYRIPPELFGKILTYL